MEILRFIIRDVFPYTHFFSAGLLLVTLVVYLILPPLRDNIQGLSMICFLFCMLVVQTEYGVILAIPYEPHTWCFPKGKIMTLNIKCSKLNDLKFSLDQHLLPIRFFHLDYCKYGGSWLHRGTKEKADNERWSRFTTLLVRQPSL